MTEPAAPPAPPAWVTKRDGRLVPFEADKISRALFAASEEVGRPDAFLARELTDGVVHFLAAEADNETPTTAQVAELVVKVVRELGQPALAGAFADFADRRERRREEPPGPEPTRPDPEIPLRFSARDPLPLILKECARTYTRHAVFARDIVAAHDDGLLTLTGLEAPLRLARCTPGPPAGRPYGLLESVEDAARFASGLVLDGPEYALAAADRQDAADFARELGAGLRLTGLSAVVNLNAAEPPPWAGELGDGPLFAGARRAAPPERLADLADALVAEVGAAALACRVDWHLAARDFRPESESRLLDLARRAAQGAALAFVFDRPRRPVALAEGADRAGPAVLMSVGLNLPRLAEQPGAGDDPERFLGKLGSLARLALSAGVQKRDFLRRHERDRTEARDGRPAVTQGFLLDRARLVAAPIGLDRVARGFHGQGMAAGGASLEFGRRVAQRLREVLRQDGRACLLDARLDGPADFRLPDDLEQPGPGEDARRVAGLTAWDAAAPARNQLRSAGALHASEAGTAALLVPRDSAPEELAEWLRWAWNKTDVVRVRLVRVGCPPFRPGP